MANIDSIMFQLIDEVNKNPEWRPIYDALQNIALIIDQTRTRTGGDTDLIADTESSVTSQDGGNRSYRVFRDEIDELHGALVEAQKKSRRLESRVFELSEVILNHNSHSRRNEQLIAELTERLDSGT